MADQKEQFAVSALLGAQPGLVGYEEGGALVNALNHDPYGVFLFDEVEKAHPEVLDILLNLFEEGWIRDRRNVVAHANKAMLVMTTNAGVAAIESGLRRNLPIEKITDEVRSALMEATSPHTGQRCFRPEFLGRASDIILFKPLDEADLRSIADLQLSALAADLRDSHEIQLSFDSDVAHCIAALAHMENVKHGRSLNGRAVRQQVDLRIATVLSRRIGEFMQKRTVKLGVQDFDLQDAMALLPERSPVPPDPDIERMHSVARHLLALKPPLPLAERKALNGPISDLARHLNISAHGE